MNVKRYLWSAVALFAFIFIYEWLVHGFLFSGMYHATMTVWRSYEEMGRYIPLAIVLQIALAFWMAFVFARLFREGGIKNGALFGLYFGLFAAILSASWYVWLPVSVLLGVGWFVSGLIEGFLGGCILGLVYRRKK